MKKLEYRENKYFNEQDSYLFKSNFKEFVSKVHFEKGNWWTNESLNYKASSLPCIKV